MKISPVKIFTILEGKAGQRIDNFLFMQLKNVPKSAIYRIIRKGKVRINKKRTKPKYKLNTGDKVRIPPIQITEQKEKIISPYLQKIAILSKYILYEDSDIIVLNKPSGTAVHSGSRLNFGIIEGLRALRPEEHFLELVHRLDRYTSGVLLIAKKYSALRFLHEQFYHKQIQKDYLALVRGQWNSQIRVIHMPLPKNTLKNGGYIVQINQKWKPSKTYFEIEERYAFATLMRCNPTTGRTHQIRIHTKYAGHPIAFDNSYGDRAFDEQLMKAQTGLSRMFLHAKTLKFVHPNTGKLTCIEAPPDKQLKQCINVLRDQFIL